ncbi:hypothetical protein [Desertivibrio insolitus]|uniref:hypothetical protein n=1 Tax=Herbiconiux sp. SYSU D00978 TaxID=2812562 RepID=UPI001A963BCB|nr:hypothetical protein [Herbiconiux sp. SYSU D00978]
MGATLPTATGRIRGPWRRRRLDGFATPLEPVEVLAALHDGSDGCEGLRFVPREDDPLLLECVTASGLRAEVRLDERTAGGCRVRCRVVDRGDASGAELDDLRGCLRRRIERAEHGTAENGTAEEPDRAGSGTAGEPDRPGEEPNPYARTGWVASED